jgi:hypothetical protein
MEILDTLLSTCEARIVEHDAGAHEADNACEIRSVSAASPRFVPGCTREREELRALQECRYRRVGQYEQGNRYPSARE